ncbi:sigma-54-dependent transcriptional regulator [Ottowia thiooxydans]|uniref:sigma-54-dependent transcriptional regulator n=1 Tax=Ottowia thiooxydans TaxID=219182 RepID=UPI0003FBB8B5|nr:sigma-54 dependent transcriptional regulator [Ottowia thiooxydans]
MNPLTSLSGPAHVLVVDDEPDLRTLYELTLLREGHRVHAAASLAQAREHLESQHFDILITDMRLPDGVGLELLHEVAAARRPERCIMITAYGSAENAVEALKAGAFDYLTKPVDLKQFRSVVASALQSSAVMPSLPVTQALPLATASLADRAAGDAASVALARLVGNSASMRGVKQRIVKVATSMAPVLVQGESGTGKELVAGAIHACSQRSTGPFVPVNCGAIPENLLEAEFFGARKGSYTGAVQDRPGFFQAARGGTLFLDEIGDLPLAMQAKLLRAIQERRVRALGETQEEPVDVRIVSATHKDLAAEVQAGRFRQDLFYRLNVIEIVVPPLRERREDLPALCEALLARIAADSGAQPLPVSPRLLSEVNEAPLRGNVRELENLLHRSLALGDGDGDDDGFDFSFGDQVIAAPNRSEEPMVAPSILTGLPPIPSDLQVWLDAQEKEMLVRALGETGFNRTAAAARLGLNLRQIRYRMARLGITGPGGEDSGDESV